ncbi:hypothetical protein CFIO01_11232 [Colletotrichum fioriniae PJ7]|uniref:Zn(2)-C6 fungal-type domain-containing protein n=1 Tax=Colletotrichum fioriniae PJ7 TaxID=1445577 RepID=A0A010QJK6_9PEZI|nr:hypothetical protein CFIO01_11232 [Colletotrichum fioriniae PJ7]
MAAQAHRRSRNGCGTCRTARIKCDEARPFCKQCERRGVECVGYQIHLKWVEISDISPDNQSASKSVIKPRSSLTICPSKKSAACRKKVIPPTSVARSLSVGPKLHNASDAFIFRHWADSLPDLVYPNPEEYATIRQPYLAFVWKENSILLPAVLAAGSAHLYALGKLKHAETLERKQRALSTMVACVKQPRTISNPQFQTSFPVYLSEEAIAASAALVGMEIMQGSHTPSIIPLLRGLKAQMQERQNLRQRVAASWPIEKDTPMMAVNVKMMAYIDTFCCVPCATHPVFDQQSWQDLIMPKCQDCSFANGPDIVFGYSMHILPVIGAAASLVDDFFQTTITPEDFVSSRCHLLDNLESACRDLPPPQHQPDPNTDPSAPPTSLKIRDANACIAAARAHSLATQIFLLRADEGDSSTLAAERPTKHPLSLVEQLSDAVAAVPLDTHAATMMVWPVFVLGCESMAVSARRYEVEDLFEKIIDKQKLLNISVALKMLRENVWTGSVTNTASPASSLSPTEESCRYTQNQWVKMCWKERLQLCSA